MEKAEGYEYLVKKALYKDLPFLVILGKVLLACSMDGSVAAVILTSKEIGTPIPDSKLYEIMREQYGKNFGTIANLKSKTMTNGGPVVIENPEMLKAGNGNAVKATNGHDLSGSNSTGTSKHRLHPKVSLILMPF